ncbi:response regulator transcription factor [Tunicatimonas pelagia]|uniref:response regulator transcription factor n=1 Tax=Tunicatimonas pelagia TaxID=931531 RepID=UPI002665D87A|nr:response regulator transcription factor [Tunicatimonas pelagia]WKN45245.1 response regulator transcription factor [Tunicatimonas pelagia]
MDHIKAVLADDHGVVRSGIKSLLESEGDIQVVAEAENGQEALQQVATYQPDIAILDIRMPIMNGLEATQKISEQEQKVKVLILSMHDDEEYILQSVESGAAGYLLKGSSKEEFLKAVRTVHEGERYFSADVSRVFVNNYLNQKPSKVNRAPNVSQNTYDLTKREKQILRLLFEGVGNKEIAEQLDKSIRTVETHRFNIMKKLGVNNVVELIKKIEDEQVLKGTLYA